MLRNTDHDPSDPRITSPPLPHTIDPSERLALALCAVSAIPSGGIVGVCGGTAMRAFAELLPRRRPVSVVTTSLEVALELANVRGIDLTVTAGETVPGTPELAGPAAIRSLRDVYLDLAVVQADGLTEDGLGVDDRLIAATIGAMMDRAATVFVIAEERAVGRRAAARVPVMPRRYTLITSAMVDPRVIAAIAEADVAMVGAG